MADEFTPEASVDFEALAAAAAAEAVLNGNGDTPHFQPPPAPPPAPAAPPIRPASRASSAPQNGDPFAQLEALARDLPLMYRELGDVNATLMRLQLTNIITFGGMLLLALFVWKVAHDGNAAG